MSATTAARTGERGRFEIWRRIGIWAIVAAFFAGSIWTATHDVWTGFGFTAWAVVGAVILTERPGNGVGRVLLGIAVFAVLTMWGLAPELMRAVPAWFESVSYFASGPFWTLVYCVTVFFPSGRVRTRLGKAVLAVAVGVGVLLALVGALGSPTLESGRANPLLVPAIAGINEFPTVVNFAILLVLFTGIVLDIVLRWRRASGVERLQFRWFVVGAVAFAVALLIALPLGALVSDRLAQTITLVAANIALNLPAVTIGIAITRHGLYSIGRVISRTITYAIVLIVIVGLYAGVVIGIGALLPADNPVPVAIATLVAAAVFLPLLRWVQRLLDRRFDRARYDAERVVEAFGSRLQSSVEPDRTVPDLVDAVTRTLRPTSIGVWTRSSSFARSRTAR